MYKLIFWDFDGVIKDSLEVKTRAFGQLFEKYGSDIAEKVKAHHESNGGMSRMEKFPLYLEWAGEEVSKVKVDELCNEFSGLVKQGVIQSPWVPGVKERLLENHDQQKFVLVSATPQQEIEDIIEALEIRQCFIAVFGAPVKKSQAIKKILAEYNLLPEECLMIGDARADMEAAAKNQVPFLLRRHTTNTRIFEDYTGPSIQDFTTL